MPVSPPASTPTLSLRLCVGAADRLKDAVVALYSGDEQRRADRVNKIKQKQENG